VLDQMQHGSYGYVRTPSYSAMQKLRIVAISGGRSLTRPFRDARRFPSSGIVACTHMYTYDAKVGICPSSIFCRAVPNPNLTIETFASLYDISRGTPSLCQRIALFSGRKPCALSKVGACVVRL
jgi:hypothetical protein